MKTSEIQCSNSYNLHRKHLKNLISEKLHNCWQRPVSAISCCLCSIASQVRRGDSWKAGGKHAWRLMYGCSLVSGAFQQNWGIHYFLMTCLTSIIYHWMHGSTWLDTCTLLLCDLKLVLYIDQICHSYQAGKSNHQTIIKSSVHCPQHQAHVLW